VDLNDRGEIPTDDLNRTNIPGVFAAGDARVKRYRQITTAVADGTIAALSAVDYVNELVRKEATRSPRQRFLKSRPRATA
jgi:thioredoxin reductase (NADPH)